MTVPECGGACCSCQDPYRCVCEPCDRCKREMAESAADAERKVRTDFKRIFGSDPYGRDADLDW